MDQDLNPSPRAGAGVRWEPHGRLLTACLVALNVFLVLTVFVYFWRFLSRARGADADAASSEASSSPPDSPKARDRREVERAITALPVFVHRRSPDAAAAATAECAICIAEFSDGEEGRLLPRCGHRFHARCVDTWFSSHTTCPLCRATVLADTAAHAAQPAQPPPRPTDTNHSDANDDDSPV